MAILLTNSDLELPAFVKQIAETLNIGDFREGESSHYIANTYYSTTALGIKIKVAYNNYNHEDRYNYFISLSTPLNWNQYAEKPVIDIEDTLAACLAVKLGNPVAIEVDESETHLKEYALIDGIVIASEIFDANNPSDGI